MLIRGINYEVKSTNITRTVATMYNGRAKCVVTIQEQGNPNHLRFTVDMKRGTMTDADIVNSAQFAAMEAITDDKSGVIAKQSQPEGYLIVEREI